MNEHSSTTTTQLPRPNCSTNCGQRSPAGGARKLDPVPEGVDQQTQFVGRLSYLLRLSLFAGNDDGSPRLCLGRPCSLIEAHVGDLPEDQIRSSDVLQPHNRVPAEHLHETVIARSGLSSVRTGAEFLYPHPGPYADDVAVLSRCRSCFGPLIVGHIASPVDVFGATKSRLLDGVVARDIAGFIHSLDDTGSASLSCAETKQTCAETRARRGCFLLGRARPRVLCV